ncbi:MAG: transcriptional repressor [Solirubrobacterales bacterium]|nr:transcriptional repressor [Solirubrobacterales bacterium]
MSEHWLERAHAALQAAGLRSGGGRELVLEELSAARCLRSAQELERTLADQGKPVSRATVYRTLETLHELALVHRVDTGSGVASFEPADPSGEHHHHTVCDRCGRVLTFADDELEAAIGRISDRLPFAVDRHDVVLRGACADCTAQPR